MDTRKRYFTATHADGSPVLTCLYRLTKSSEAIGEDQWMGTEWRDANTEAVIVRYLVTGQGDFDEITEELAKQTWPEAFVVGGAA